jgi:hypothetical protein
LLKESLDTWKLPIVFTLGNHELWSFSGCKLDEIVNWYEKVITENDMFLLQNNIIYKTEENDIQIISREQLISIDKKQLREKLVTARWIVFGGIGFSGYNSEFNADNGIYRHTIDRNQEILESQEFEKLHDKICGFLDDRNVIVVSHTPLKDWHKYNTAQPGFIYISGHDHKNYFYDDGEYRFYADNQIGYRNENPQLKYFLVEDEFDYFSEYEDGIFEITREQYIYFYKGKRISMQFNREVNELFMLKKNGYYLFIHMAKYGELSILNGGVYKILNSDNLEYYYAKMGEVISHLEKPFKEYTAKQERIAFVIKEIGGQGRIHGAIIDIDFYNHIFVNPVDASTIGYWALDMRHKKVYSSINQLLEIHCPLLYKKLIETSKTSYELISLFENEQTQTVKVEYNADIYKASRRIKKMQKLNKKILTTWYEPNQFKVDG